MPDVELVQLGAAAIGGDDELPVGAPAEAAHRMRVDRDRALGAATGRRQGPRLVRTGALVGNDRERETVGRQRERGPAGEAAGRVRYLREALARMEVRERAQRCHRPNPTRIDRMLDGLSATAREASPAGA